jgi:hypothetical protein
MGIKIGNVVQAKAFAVTYLNDNASYAMFNLPSNSMITAVKCGGKTVLNSASTFTVKTVNAGTAVGSAVTVATIDMTGPTVTMTAGSDASFVRLGAPQTVYVSADNHSASAGDLTITVEFM